MNVVVSVVVNVVVSVVVNVVVVVDAAEYIQNKLCGIDCGRGARNPLGHRPSRH